MASILNAAVLIGEETTYGTAVTPTRAYEAQADTFKTSVEFLETESLRGGFQTLRDNRRKVIELGGEGTITMDFIDEGMALILKGMIQDFPTEDASGAPVYVYGFNSSVDNPETFFTVQVQRPDTEGVVTAYNYVSSVVTGWSLTQNVGEFLSVEFNFDAEDVDEDATAVGGVSSLYPEGRPFDWTQAVATWGGNPIDLIDFSLTADLMLKTDRRFLRGDFRKKQPIRTGIPVYEGQFTAEFENNDLYDAFAAGDTDKPITVTWTSDETVTGDATFKSLELTIPSPQFNGDDPQANLGDTTVQTVPFKVLHNGTDDAIQFVYTTNEDPDF